ncbi:MAG: hypothetical protein IKO45_02320 [Clostridia bacterium]|nr:hypothetical protein [Clostridia bacterium]
MSLLRIDLSVLEKLIKDFDIKLYKLPRTVQMQLITTAADKVLKQLKITARDKTHGQYSLSQTDRDTIANAAYIDTRHIDDYIPYAEINFKGTTSRYYEPRKLHPRQTASERLHGTFHMSNKTGITENGRRRIAEIAFLNEYGVPRNPNQKARGYMTVAMNEGMAQALDPLLDILEQYIANSIAL